MNKKLFTELNVNENRKLIEKKKKIIFTLPFFIRRKENEKPTTTNQKQFKTEIKIYLCNEFL